jgi:hypothetical protein
MNAKILTVGDITDAYCTSCRIIMNHTIVSIVATSPARVQCNTCHGVHNYRKSKSIGSEAKATIKTGSNRQPKKVPGGKACQEWVALQLSQTGTRAAPYSMQSVYKVGDFVNHPKFGLGAVKQLLGPNKVEILFKEGLKLLRCG